MIKYSYKSNLREKRTQADGDMAFIVKEQTGANEMAQKVKTSTTKPDFLNMVSGSTHDENHLLQVAL